MGGAHCALVNCSAKKSKNKGLSFFKIPKKGVNDEWRIQLLHKINRADDGFNADTARICSRHFLDSCIQITQKGVKKLIPGSLPTEEMPVKSVETPRPLSRKAPTDREPPLQPLRVSYFTLDDVRKDASRLISPWVILENGEHLAVGTVTNYTVRVHVTILPTLFTSVTVLGLPCAHLNSSLETIRLKDYLLQLSALLLCPGVTSPQLQTFSKLPTPNNTSQHFLHVSCLFKEGDITHTSCVRSKDCCLLSTDVVCKNCTEVEKKLSVRQKTTEESAQKPLHRNDPLHTASKEKLKGALKGSRKREKQLQTELNRIQQKLEHESVTVGTTLHEGMKTILQDHKPSNPLMKLFWEEQSKAFQVNGPKGMKWHPMLIRLALLLHSKGPAAYNTLRDTGILKLPGESTLRDYTNHIHPKTGFQPEVLAEIRKAAEKLRPNERYVALLHDEMTIREDLVFDKRSEELVGFVNLHNWTENSVDTNSIASHVLVFYVVGINSSLKASMGFFGTRTATADQMFPLFWKAVGFLEQTCQLKVMTSTSDKASSNQRLYQLHSQQNEICYKTKNFFAPERHIFFFSDVPHLVKTVRNNLFRSGYGKTSLLWNNGKELLWEHISAMYLHDSMGQLRKTKLTNDHVNLTGHSTMNVKLAAQVLSRSVGRIMQDLGREECQETAQFILLMDRFFDCLNSRSLTEAVEKRKPDLQPYTAMDDPRFEFLDEFLKYLEDWRRSVLNREGHFSKADRAKMFLSHQTFKGLVMTINAFKEVTRYLMANGVSFVLSNKFCQDPLEAHFGRHRGLGRRTENPSLQEYGYNENKIRIQRSVAMTVTPKGNIEKRKRADDIVNITHSPLKRRKH